MDERVMVMEQERLTQEKKRKKARKRMCFAGAIVLAGIIGSLLYVGWRQHANDTMDSTVQISAGIGQDIIYAELTCVNGNEITYQEEQGTATILIPVGTDVITKLGTVTTFSRLAAGDKIGLVVEEHDGEQVVMTVYIVE